MCTAHKMGLTLNVGDSVAEPVVESLVAQWEPETIVIDGMLLFRQPSGEFRFGPTSVKNFQPR